MKAHIFTGRTTVCTEIRVTFLNSPLIMSFLDTKRKALYYVKSGGRQHNKSRNAQYSSKNSNLLCLKSKQLL